MQSQVNYATSFLMWDRRGPPDEGNGGRPFMHHPPPPEVVHRGLVRAPGGRTGGTTGGTSGGNNNQIVVRGVYREARGRP